MRFWTAIREMNVWAEAFERLEEVDSLEDGITLIEKDYAEEDEMNGVDTGNDDVAYLVVDEDDNVLYCKEV